MSPLRLPTSPVDVVVVGARVAGAATALLLARRGLDVLLVDRGRYGSDTLSTLALMRAGVLQLHRWGLLESIVAADTPPVRTTTFHYGEAAVEVAIRAAGGIDALFAPRRTVLDARLVDAARAAGVRVVHEVRALDLLRGESGRVNGVLLEDPLLGPRPVRASLVIGADGANSHVARWVDAPIERSARNASGVIYGLWSGLDLQGYHWHFRPGVSAGVIPTNDGLCCVFVATTAGRFERELRGNLEGGYHRLLAETDPGLAARIATARRVGGLRGFAGRPGFLRRGWGPGWALVGDAGYFKDPITAHGITDALRDAELLARAVATGGDQELAGYQESRDDLSRDLFELTDAVAGYDWDLVEVQRLHLALNEAQRREVRHVGALDSAWALPRSA